MPFESGDKLRAPYNYVKRSDKTHYMGYKQAENPAMG